MTSPAKPRRQEALGTPLALDDASSEVISELRKALLAYYRANKRDLPWRRRSADAYAVWVSEIMLQQTQVDTVVPRYEQFLREFPTVERLAAASEQRVCEAWAGLGYYRRARNLHAAARQVVEQQAGRLPDTAEALMLLPGIGRYTAGAIASIAFGRQAPLVDGNVARVLSRIFTLTDAPGSPAGQKRLWALASALVPGPDPGDLNQALMELGALVCSPNAPQCGQCPVIRHCGAAKSDSQLDYPVPTAKAAPKDMDVAFAWIAGPTGAGVWLVQRPLEGLWAGLWELPSAEGKGGSERELRRMLEGRLAVRLSAEPVTMIRHQLTHRTVSARIYEVDGGARAEANAKIATPARRMSSAAELQLFEEPLEAPLSALARKAIAAMLALVGTTAR